MSGIGSSSENVRPTVDLCTPNALEAEHLYALALEEGLVDPYTPTKGDGIASLHAEAASLGIEENLLVAARGLAPLFRTLFIKLGSQGVLLMTRARSQAQAPDFASTSHVHFRRFPGLRAPTVHSTTGCGDTFAGALLAGLEDVLDSRTASTSTSTSGKMASMSAPASEEELERMVDLAQRAAVMTLESELAVSPELDRLRIGYQRS